MGSHCQNIVLVYKIPFIRKKSKQNNLRNQIWSLYDLNIILGVGPSLTPSVDRLWYPIVYSHFELDFRCGMVWRWRAGGLKEITRKLINCTPGVICGESLNKSVFDLELVPIKTFNSKSRYKKTLPFNNNIQKLGFP